MYSSQLGKGARCKNFKKFQSNFSKIFYLIFISGDKKRSYDEINPNIAIARALATNNFPKKIMNIVEEYQVFKNIN